MKKMRKLFAVLLTLAMVLGMSMTTFAAATPSANDKATATVRNVEATATVTAYQITKANYSTNGFTGYSAVDGVTLANVLRPTSDEITAIVNNSTLLNSLPKQSMTTTATEGLGDFTASLAPGYWVVIVNGTVKEVYNPMLVGVYYSKDGSDNTMTSDPVDANSNWTLETTGAWAKSTSPSITKEIVNPGSGNSKGDDVAIGDTVNFKITTTIPSYSDQYKTVTVKISDTLSAGLKLNADSIKINGAAVSANMGTLTTRTDGFDFVVKSEYAKANGGKELVVTYSAELTSDAAINFDPNTNTATLEYTNNPDGTVDKTTDKTYTYTFAIGANLSATEGLTKVDTKQIIKVDENGNVISTVTEKSETPVSGKTEVLKGATFRLTNNTTEKVYTATTDVNGSLTFKGLDAGTYTLVETDAPEGFTLDTTEHTVVISATYNADGTLDTYTITIDGKATSTYTAVYDKGTITEITGSTTVTRITNTTLGELPSTGGIGTTIFTIAGCIVMITAAGLFFATRRKTHK